MQTPADAFMVGMIIGALVAGVLCGSLPFAVARSRKRNDLAWISMVVCVVCGLLLGLLLAVPAALVCTGIIMALRRGEEPTHLDRWQAMVSPAVDLTAPAPTAAADNTAAPKDAVPGPSQRPAALFARSNLGAGELSIYCPKCHNPFPAAATNLPPWCTRCGADLPRNLGQAQAAPPANAPPASDLAEALRPAPSDAIQTARSDAFQSAPPGGVRD
jgi:hypothetical protein